MTDRTAGLHLGEGAYTVHDAWSYLRRRDPTLAESRVRGWVSTELVPAAARGHGKVLVDFLDLVSLEVIRRLSRAGATTQAIRKAGAFLREEHGLERPFAYRVFHTDGQRIWAEVFASVEEIVGPNLRQQVMRHPLDTFTTQILWSEREPAIAVGWDLAPGIRLDPELQFGAPVLSDSRIPVATIAANLAEGTPEQVADWYGLPVQEVQRAAEFLRSAT